MKFRFYCIAIFLFIPLCIHAQRTDREFVRKGNKLFADSLYIKAEENYLKAIDKNSASIEATYNLGNTYIEQQKGQEAVDQYQKAITIMELEYDKLSNSGNTSDKELKELDNKIAQAYHNTGVVMQASQNYGPAVAAYKQALRRNPTDHETRYNLALAMHQLKEREKQQDQKNQDQQEQKQEQKQDQQQQEQQQDQQQQKPEQNQQQQEQQSEKQDEMSQENAEQLLEAAMQDEKDVQERVQKSIQIQSKGQLDKDW